MNESWTDFVDFAAGRGACAARAGGCRARVSRGAACAGACGAYGGGDAIVSGAETRLCVLHNSFVRVP